MLLRPQIQIQSMIKALQDVVIPALDPDNKLAQEQIGLIVGTLNLMAQQEPHQFAFDLDELQRLIDLAAELKSAAGSVDSLTSPLAELDRAMAGGSATIEAAQAGPQDLRDSIRALRAATGTLITQVYEHADSTIIDKIQAATLHNCGEQLLRDRALLKPQGWEPVPDAVPDISELLKRA